MSQAKVDRYKNEKANRKQILAKQKAKKKMQKIAGSFVAIAAVVWIGFSAVDAADALMPRPEIEIDYTVFDDYIQELSAE